MRGLEVFGQMPGVVDEEEPAQPDAIYVRDSALAMEKYALCQRMVQSKEWNTAADVLQEIVDNYPDRVLQRNPENNDVAKQYTSVALWAQQQLANWPADGRAAYQGRFEPAAHAMLARVAPGDIAALQGIYSRYFATPSGLEAGRRLVDQYFTAGDFAAAEWIATNLVQWHPDLGKQRPAVLFRQGLAAHMAGDEAVAEKAMKALKEQYADVTETLGGREANLLATLTEAMAQPPAMTRGSSADSWPMLGGDATRSRVSSANAHAGARMYSIPLAEDASIASLNSIQQITQFGQPGQNNMNVNSMDRSLELTPARASVQPVADRGQLFYQTDSSVVGLDMDNGQPLPGWLESYPKSGGRYSQDSIPILSSSNASVALTDDSVLAIVTGMDKAYSGEARDWSGYQPDMLGTQLVCLDRANGKVRWSLRAADLPESTGAARSVEIQGSPLVMGDFVYVMLGGSKRGQAGQLLNAYLLAVDVHTGKYRWSTYLSSANPPVMDYYGDVSGMGQSNPPAAIAGAGGRLFVSTNLGTVAAVDAFSGNISWMNTYARITQGMINQRVDMLRQQAGGMSQLPAAVPWSLNPVIVQGGNVFVMPSDANALMIYAMADGKLVKTINASEFVSAAGDGGGAIDTLVSVDGNRMIVAGMYQVLCLDWMTSKPGDISVIWPQRLARDSLLRGRPFVCGDLLLVPTAARLLGISLKSGIIAETYPDSRTSGTWADGEEPGNIIAVGDRVVVAGATRLSVFTDMGIASRKLDELERLGPNDPEPRLRYAQILFNAGKTAPAMDKLEEALKLQTALTATTHPATDGSKPNAEPLPPGRIFTIAMQFAQSMSHSPGAAVDVVERSYVGAEAAASSDPETVQCLLSRIDYAYRNKTPDDAIKYCQQILASEDLSRVALRGHVRPIQAGDRAQQVIDKLITTFSRSFYAPYDKEAEEILDRAKGSGDIAALKALADQYPNAQVVPKALQLAADLCEQKGEYQQAVEILLSVSHRYRTSVNAAELAEGMIRNYLRIPGKEQLAAWRMAYAARELGDPKMEGSVSLPDGQVLVDMTFSQALEQFNKLSVKSPALPAPVLHLPARGWANEPGNAGKSPLISGPLLVSDISKLVMPLRAGARQDRIITWSAKKGLRVFMVGSTKEVLANAKLAEEPQGAAWQGDRLMVWTGAQVSLLDEAGQAVWTAKLSELPRGQMAIDSLSLKAATDVQSGGSQESNESYMANGQVQVIVRNGQVIRMINGRVVNISSVDSLRQASTPISTEEQWETCGISGGRILLATSAGRVMALDGPSGKLLWQVQVGSESISNLLVTDEFAVARLGVNGGEGMVAMDASSGRIISWISPSQNLPLSQVALSPEGMLVYATVEQLCAKDLFQPGDKPDWSLQGGVSLSNFNLPGLPGLPQLVLADGRVIVLSTGGESIRIHSLDTGRLVKYKPANQTREVDAVLTTGGAQDVQTALIVDQGNLYALSARGIYGYNLEHPDISWSAMVSHPMAMRRMLVASDFLVVDDQSTQGRTAPGRAGVNGNDVDFGSGEEEEISSDINRTSYATRERLAIFDRSQVKDRESGLLLYLPVLRDDAGIVDVKLVPGGLYYLNGDDVLSFMPAVTTVQ